jgi:hypothetical protein
VYLLTEVTDLVARFGIPSPLAATATEPWTTWPQDTYIEVQLWTDEPVRRHLHPSA